MTLPTARPEILATYWQFAAERQRAFYRRLAGLPRAQWTDDPIIKEYKFTNAYRASDYVSQHLIWDVVYSQPELDEDDVFLRVFLARTFSRVETWPIIEPEGTLLTADSFDPIAMIERLTKARSEGTPIYTAAFIQTGSGGFGHQEKHGNHIALASHMLASGIVGKIAKCKSLQAVVELFQEYTMVGPFIAYQLAIDLNYTWLLDYDENDYVLPGPGAVRGLHKIFTDLGDYSPGSAIRWLAEAQQGHCEALGVDFPSLWGRPLHAIDCQNLCCEVDKYCRVAYPDLKTGQNYDRVKIKQRFTPLHKPRPPFYPPKWQINDRIAPSLYCAPR